MITFAISRRSHMLTEAALRERKWGRFPALRQVIEAAPESSRHSGMASVDDTVFARIQRLVEIAGRAEEQSNALLKAAQESPQLKGRIADDLWRLKGELGSLRHAFDTEIDSVAALLDQVHRL